MERNILAISGGGFSEQEQAYNDEKHRRQFDRWSKKQEDIPLYAVNDNENLHFRNEQLTAKMTSYIRC